MSKKLAITLDIAKEVTRSYLKMRDNKSSLEVARDWYHASQIHDQLKRSRGQIPEDHTGREFAEWLTRQYHLAMAKGIELGRGYKSLDTTIEIERLKTLLHRVIHGSWTVTEIQEALNLFEPKE